MKRRSRWANRSTRLWGNPDLGAEKAGQYVAG